MARQRVYRRASGRRQTQKRKKAKIPSGLVFWTAFLILIAGLFFINRDHIRESLEKTHLLERIIPQPSAGEQDPAEDRNLAVEQPAAHPPVERDIVPAPVPEAPVVPAVPAARPGSTQSTPRPIEQYTPPPAVQESYTDRTLYFIRVEDDGMILRSKTTRRFPVSGTPLQDTLQSLITGPDAGEEQRGMRSLIPPETRVLNAVIEGSTARINFSEEFQYNTDGMDGFAAQLIQIIWTATEFPNVKDVQILIEGNRIDHLGEGIPIWGPLNRQSF
ncbi:MAG: GerMN domain-containing protein [Treponema sp.]|nr:GerMN domain-containing protein [Treponema sp.]